MTKKRDLKPQELQLLRTLWAYEGLGYTAYGDDSKACKVLASRGLAEERATDENRMVLRWFITRDGKLHLVDHGGPFLYDLNRIWQRWCEVKEPLEKRLSFCSTTYVKLHTEYMHPWKLIRSLMGYKNEGDWITWRNDHRAEAVLLCAAAERWLEAELEGNEPSADAHYRALQGALGLLATAPATTETAP